MINLCNIKSTDKLTYSPNRDPSMEVATLDMKSLDMKYMEMRQERTSSYFSRFFDVKMTSADTLIISIAYTCQQPSTTITFQAILRMFH